MSLLLRPWRELLQHVELALRERRLAMRCSALAATDDEVYGRSSATARIADRISWRGASFSR